MEFEIDNYNFSKEIDLSDNIKIKSLSKTYDVFYSKKDLDTLINELYESNDFIFIDRNVYNLSPLIFQNNKNIMIFDAIENNKVIESVLQLTDQLYNINFTKKNKLIVIGGGITQDVGGFAAAIYKSLEYADSVSDIAKANDVAIDSVIKLQNALANSGGEAENAGKILSSFTNYVDSAANGSLDAQRAFEKAGISLKD